MTLSFEEKIAIIITILTVLIIMLVMGLFVYKYQDFIFKSDNTKTEKAFENSVKNVRKQPPIKLSDNYFTKGNLNF